MPALLEALRPHQWSKNLLLAVPALVGQAWMQAGVATQVLLAIVAFCLVASGTYLLNDLLDLESDRGHPDKRRRPFADGRLNPLWGQLGGPLLVGLGCGLAVLTLSRDTVVLLLVYVLASAAYTLWLKRVLLVDVILLAGLYSLRLLAGGAAAGVAVSSWLLAFSMFLFLSLALAKRLTELQAAPHLEAGRAYRPVDREAFAAMGPAAGMLSILVLALYVSSEPIRSRYVEPDALWLLCPLLLYWILRVWFLALRGELHSDPVVFALRDGASYVVLAGMLAVFYLAAA